MKDFKSIIEAHSVPMDKSWIEEIERREAAPWFKYSSHIAAIASVLIVEDETMNQSRLAKAIGVSRQQISKILQGGENLTLETIYKLSKALGFELISFPSHEKVEKERLKREAKNNGARRQKEVPAPRSGNKKKVALKSKEIRSTKKK